MCGWIHACGAGIWHATISTNKEAPMVKMINWLTGTEMYVAEERLDEYLKRGHKLPIKAKEPKTKTAAPKSKKGK